jgi:acyl-CoA-dependent ceramide synthase
MFRYLSLTNLTDATFVIFLLSWIFTRQIGLFLVIKSVYTDLPRYVPFEWSPETGRFLTFTTWSCFVGMLGVVGVLSTVWFYMACRVAYRVVRGFGAEDSRSEDEGEESPLEDVPEMNSSSQHITKTAPPTPSPTPSPEAESKKRR